MAVVLKLLALVVVVIFSVLLIRTNQLLWTQDQTNFSEAPVVETLPDGTYAGTLAGPKGSWLGKKFSAAEHSGVNLFKSPSGAPVQKYPFLLSIGPGVHDYRNVIQVDYNVPGNPFWIRPVLDELVSTAPNEYLGKLQLRIIPGYPFTLTYFRLATSS